MSDKRFLLDWGESVLVRQRFVETFFKPSISTHKEFCELGYTKFEGEPELIELTRQIVKRQIGLEYKHVLMTVGATGATTLAIRAYAQKGYQEVITRAAPYFSLYPSMIASSRLIHSESRTNPIILKDDGATLILIDSPSNPFGREMSWDAFNDSTPIIWDSAYHSNIYRNLPSNNTPRHTVLVGSYSKLTGLNGIRVGWIATNDDLLYERFKELVKAEYCGISRTDGNLLLNLLKGREDRWDEFETTSRYWLNMNREEWSKLEKFFGGAPVYPAGMFYYAPMDEACKRLMGKSNVVWTKGSSMGHNDGFGRFNIGQDPKLVRSAVRTILKNDKIK